MSVTVSPCCLLCLVEIEANHEDESICYKSDNDNSKKLFRKFLKFVKCRLKLEEIIFLKSSSASLSLSQETSVPSLLCERCSEVASSLCDLYKELRSMETRMLLKLEEMEAILSLDRMVSKKKGIRDLERFREILTRQVRWYFDVERSKKSKEDEVDSDPGSESEIENEPENRDYDDDSSTFSVSSDNNYEEEVNHEFNFNEEEDPLKIEIEAETHTEEQQQPTVTNQSQGKRSRKSAVIPRQEYDEFSVSEVELPPVPSTSSSNNQYQSTTEPEPVPPQTKRPKLSDALSHEGTEKDWSSVSCGICKVTTKPSFADAKDLMLHMRWHEVFASKSKIGKPDFHCPFCSKVYYYEDTLKVHLETLRHWHVTRYFPDLRFRCDGEHGDNECCTETYETFADLGNHLKMYHPGAIIYHCGKCKWPF